MTRPDAGRPDDAADFLDFAAARQGPALRGATLVTGDPATGERAALAALTALAADWTAAREEGPDRALRALLFRRAVAASDEPAPTTAEVEQDPEEDGTDPVDVEVRRGRVRAALRSVPGRARAAAVLRWLEEQGVEESADLLGARADEVRADVDAVRGALRAVAPDLDEDAARGLLELVADEVIEVEIAGSAWAAAQARRRTVRRRTALVGGVLAATGVAGVVAGREDPRPPAPSPRPSPSDGRLPSLAVAGGRVLLAPAPADETSLPRYRDAARTALPERFGPGEERPLPLLSPTGNSSSVRAVYLVRVRAERYQPAILQPRRSARVALVPMAALRPTVDPTGGRAVHLGPRTIDSDRHRLVFAQPGAVVLLDVRSARTHRFEVPDEHLTRAGWAPDNETLVVTGEGRGWLVDARTGAVTRSAHVLNPGWGDLASSVGQAAVRSFSGRGRLVSLRSIDGPDLDLYGDSISNTEGWVCRGAYIGEIAATGNRLQGLVAVQGDLRPSPRILAASAVEGVPLAAYRPLGWGPRNTVILESRRAVAGRIVSRVLAWDVVEDRLFVVGEVDPASDAEDEGFTGAWTL